MQRDNGTMFAEPPTLETYLPADLQVKATMHFTPAAVARRVARLLAPQPGARVLDVGAGPGLFCLAGALAVPWAEFFGVEWRSRLVDVAVGLAERLELANAYFIHADVLAVDWSVYDAFYLFNPFAEHVLESPFVIDRSVALHPDSYVRYVAGVQDRLAVLPLGTRVATFHGFGGELPPGYVLVTEEAHGTDKIELWIRAR